MSGVPAADTTVSPFRSSDSSMLMKYCLVLGFAIGTLFSSAAGNETDAQRAGYRGRVRFVERYETYYCCSPNQRNRLPKKLAGTTTFNKKGGYVEWVSITNTSDGPYYERRVFRYASKGRKVGADVYRSEKNPPETYFRLVRGANGSVKLWPERTEKLVERIAYTHDRDGRLIEEITRDVNENLILRRVYQFDGAGNLIRGTVYKDGGVIDNESFSIVVGDGVIESIGIRPGSNFYRSVYAKDKAGRVIWGEAFELKTDGEKGARWIRRQRSRHTYTDGRERMDWILHDPDGSPREKLVIFRDEHGNEISREEFNAGPLPVGGQNEDIEPPWTLRERTLYRREHDKKGNEVRSETRQQCGPDLPLELTHIYENVITYY